MKIFTHAEAQKACLEYFNGDALATDAVIGKYLLRNREGELLESTPNDYLAYRIPNEFHRIESKYPNPVSLEEIRAALGGISNEDLEKNPELKKSLGYGKIVPQGSPTFGIGNNFRAISLGNCYVLGQPTDSYGGILQKDQEIVQVCKRRGGAGVEISGLRPKGSIVNNAALTSDGILAFMRRYSNSTKEVAQGGRRGALMIGIDCRHPETMSFINAKKNKKDITGANISVKWHDDFFVALQKGEKYKLRYPVDVEPEKAQIVVEIDAKELWDAFIDSAWHSAEPGCFFWDTVLNQSMSDSYADEGFRTIISNPSLKGNTLILTSQGCIPIKQLDGETVGIRNIHGDWVPAKVFKSGKNKQLYKIVFTNRQEVFCTAEHKWPIINTSGNYFNPQTGMIIKKKTTELIRQDKIYLPFDKDPINNESCKWTREDGFVVGWLLGDGWCTYHKTSCVDQYGFVFGKKDKSSGIMESILGKINSISERPCSASFHKGAYQFQSSSLNVRKYFEGFGYDKTKNSIPSGVWISNSEFIKGFVDGIFSSDGHISLKMKSLVLSSSRIGLLKDVQKLLCFFGIRSQIYTYKRPSSFKKGEKSSSKRLYTSCKLVVSTKHAQKFASIFTLTHKSKQDRLSYLLNSDVGKYGKKCFGNREYLVVREVIPTDIYEDVYDVTVDDDTHTLSTECGITSNCGEILMSEYNACLLMVLNVMKFVKNPYTKNARMDWEDFDKQAALATRLMDDLVDLEIEKTDQIIAKVKADPEPEHVKRTELELWENVRKFYIRGRRTGLGITGLADLLAQLNIKYDSEQALEFCDKLFARLQEKVYETSAILAKERGPFPCWDWEKEKDSHYIKKLSKETQALIKKHGRRNIANLTMSPAGTTSLVTRTSSGIEPVYEVIVCRRRKMSAEEEGRGVKPDAVDFEGNKWVLYTVKHPGLIRWEEITGETNPKNSPYWKCDAMSIDPFFRVRLQGIIQKHIDHSISSTVNLPQNISKETVGKLYLEAWRHKCKGLTIYRAGSLDAVIKTVVDKNDGNRPKDITESSAPKRPTDLSCHIHSSIIKGTKWVFIVGLLNGKPYEVFGGKMTEIEVAKKYIKGHESTDALIHKNPKNADGYSTYDLVLGTMSGEKVEIKDIAKKFSPDNGSPTRLISMLLRHGVPINDICEQIRKVPQEDSMLTFEKGVGRVLRKYVADKTDARGVCAECGSKLVYSGGCVKCSVCTWSRCD